MFKQITLKEQVKKLVAENNKLRLEKSQLEDALFELAQYVSEVKNGEVVCTEDNE
jgi:regulator of replication initiation timing